jgi:hypothetical protein
MDISLSVMQTTYTKINVWSKIEKGVLLFYIYNTSETDASDAIYGEDIGAGNNAGTSAFQRSLYVIDIDNTKTPHWVQNVGVSCPLHDDPPNKNAKNWPITVQ